MVSRWLDIAIFNGCLWVPGINLPAVRVYAESAFTLDATYGRRANGAAWSGIADNVKM